jgi:hypothetical protein
MDRRTLLKTAFRDFFNSIDPIADASAGDPGICNGPMLLKKSLSTADQNFSRPIPVEKVPKCLLAIFSVPDKTVASIRQQAREAKHPLAGRATRC